jgi:hypothetical protein
MNQQIVMDATFKLCAILEQNFNVTNTFSVDLGFGRVYEIVEGKKYLKIIMRDVADGVVLDRSGSVHAFVDKKNADLYKAAGWAAPAKGVRFNLITDMQKLEEIATWSGGYLYKR